MPRFIRKGDQKIEILIWYECDSKDTYIEFRDELLALVFLRDLANDPLNILILRDTFWRIFEGDIATLDIFRVSNYDILQRLAREIARDYIRLVVREDAIAVVSGEGTSETSEEEEEAEPSEAESQAETAPAGAAAATAEEENNWIAFRVVDDETGDPLSGIRLRVKLPTGVVSQYTTNADGTVRIDGLPSGTCDIEEISDSDVLEVVQVE